MYGVWDIAQNNTNVSPNFFNPVAGDFHTQSGSPCINAGSPGAPSLPATDLDGSSRTNNAGLVDMGCYEFNTTATHPADTNNNFVISAAEFNAYRLTAWKTGQSWTQRAQPNPGQLPHARGLSSLMTNGERPITSDGRRPTHRLRKLPAP